MTQAAERRLRLLARRHAVKNPRDRVASNSLGSSDEERESEESESGGVGSHANSLTKTAPQANADDVDDFIVYDEELGSDDAVHDDDDTGLVDSGQRGSPSRPASRHPQRESPTRARALQLEVQCRCGFVDAVATATYRGLWLPCAARVCGTRQHARCYGVSDAGPLSESHKHLCDSCLASAVRRRPQNCTPCGAPP